MIIGIAGAAYAGKTTLAEMFCSLGGMRCVVIPFARAVKDMARTFGWDGKKDEKGRRFLQLLGTEIGRAYIPTFWVDRWEDSVINERTRLSYEKVCVIADDVRFENEVSAVRGLGGIIIRLDAREELRRERALKKGEDLPPAHASEKGIEDWDVLMNNNGSVEELMKAARSLWEEHRE